MHALMVAMLVRRLYRRSSSLASGDQKMKVAHITFAQTELTRGTRGI